MEMVQQCGFDEIFNYAGTKYGIGWNDANDVFFNNAFRYGKKDSFYVNDWAGYIGDLPVNRYLDAIDRDEYFKASDFTVEEVQSFDDLAKAYIITAAFFEEQGVTGEVQIDGT